MVDLQNRLEEQFRKAKEDAGQISMLEGRIKDLEAEVKQIARGDISTEWRDTHVMKFAWVRNELDPKPYQRK